ncbi:hypothetical protein SSCG_05736 [Streptomyces clavuligerus]|nr:hypothetical protein SSCG_05736 [Streptomyces clavuligerus]
MLSAVTYAATRAEPNSEEQDRLYDAAHFSNRDRAWARSLIGGGTSGGTREART